MNCQFGHIVLYTVKNLPNQLCDIRFLARLKDRHRIFFMKQLIELRCTVSVKMNPRQLPRLILAADMFKGLVTIDPHALTLMQFDRLSFRGNTSLSCNHFKNQIRIQILPSAHMRYETFQSSYLLHIEQMIFGKHSGGVKHTV